MIQRLILHLGLVMVAVALNLPVGAAAEPIEIDGLIEPCLIVKVGSAVPGILDTVAVDRGDLIEKGQVLAQLKSSVEMATKALMRARAEMKGPIRSKRARLEFAKRRQDRMEELFSNKVISTEDMDETRTNSEIAEGDIEEAIENIRIAELEYKRSVEILKRMTINSPITGVVMERYLTAGEYVEDQPILKVAQIDPLNVEVFAPVTLLGSIKVGMTAEVRPMAPVGGSYTAKVTIVDRIVDAASGTFGVRLQIPNPKNRLVAGVRCKIIFADR